MIGNPSGEPDCVQAIQEKLTERQDILFIPGLSKEWISSAMQAANVVVLSSKGEGSPITILEAMSHKKPWIATPECGAANDHLGGVISHLKDFKKFLAIFSQNPLLLEELGGIGYLHWRQHYSWSAVMNGWINLIERGELVHPLVLDPNLIKRMLDINNQLLEVN